MVPVPLRGQTTVSRRAVAGKPEDMARAAETTPPELPTLVFVSRRTCGRSRRMASLVAWVRVTKKRQVHVVDLDADRSPELTRRLGVRETPSLLLLERGRVVGRLDGRSTGRQIEELIGPELEDEQVTATTDGS